MTIYYNVIEIFAYAIYCQSEMATMEEGDDIFMIEEAMVAAAEQDSLRHQNALHQVVLCS